MKSTFFSIIFLNIFTIYAETQNLVWTKSIGGTNSLYICGIYTESVYNIYTTEYFYGIADFDPDINIANVINSTGDYVRAKQLETGISKSYGIDVGPFGVYFTGTYKYSTQLDGYSIFPSEPWYYNAFIVEFGFNGDLLLTNTIESKYYINPYTNDTLSTCLSIGSDVAAISINGMDNAYFTRHFEDTIKNESYFFFDIMRTGIDNTLPNITCKNHTTINLPVVSTYYTVQGNELDPLHFSDNCLIDTIFNTFKNLSSLQGSNLNPVTHQISWEIYDNAGFTDTCTFSVTINSGVGINNANESEISIYPNPSNSLIKIDFGAIQGEKQITILNYLGQIVFYEFTNKNQTEINIRSLSEEILFIKVETKTNSYII